MPKIQIYANGLIYCSVCADKKLDQKEVEKLVNQENPTGINSLWQVSKENFRDGAENPHSCEKDGNRLHHLLSC